MIKGRHATVFLFGPFAIKVFKKGLEENAKKEWFFLNFLKKYGFVPKPYFKIGRIIVMERIRGKSFKEMGEEEIKRNFPKFLKILAFLDKLGINKEECHRPNKHFILTKEGPKLIDFERAHFSKKPHNVTQFLSFISRFDKRAIEVAKKYKRGETSELGELLAQEE